MSDDEPFPCPTCGKPVDPVHKVGDIAHLREGVGCGKVIPRFTPDSLNYGERRA